MSSVRIGWYRLEEDFNEDGIDIAIRDPRTGELYAFKLDDLQAYDDLICFLDKNRQIGTLERLASDSKA